VVASAVLLLILTGCGGNATIITQASSGKSPVASTATAPPMTFTNAGNYTYLVPIGVTTLKLQALGRRWKKWDTAWRNLRTKAGLPKLRFHDLRHTIITELAAAGVPDHVMESMSGHLSRQMLEHYSHVRLQAKREALDALDARREARFGEIAGKSSTQ